MNVQNKGGGVKGRFNSVKKNRQFGTGELPLGNKFFSQKINFFWK